MIWHILAVCNHGSIDSFYYVLTVRPVYSWVWRGKREGRGRWGRCSYSWPATSPSWSAPAPEHVRHSQYIHDIIHNHTGVHVQYINRHDQPIHIIVLLHPRKTKCLENVIQNYTTHLTPNIRYCHWFYSTHIYIYWMYLFDQTTNIDYITACSSQTVTVVSLFWITVIPWKQWQET